jgi:integrase
VTAGFARLIDRGAACASLEL